MSETVKLTIDDGGECLTAQRLVRIVEAFDKLMRACGMDNVAIPVLHYEFGNDDPAHEKLIESLRQELARKDETLFRNLLTEAKKKLEELKKELKKLGA